MERDIVQSLKGVTLVGGGQPTPGNMADALARAPSLVAADGGANFCLAAGHRPEAVIGDFDSLDPATRTELPDADFIHVAEQESTDFEKCLTRITAPFILATGFTAKRLDHTLAVLSVLARDIGPPTLLLGEEDIVLAAPKHMALDLGRGTRLSLFPLAPFRGRSTGLKWPIDELFFVPNGQIGTSNETTGPVTLEFDGPGCLIILPRTALDIALRARLATEGFPAD